MRNSAKYLATILVFCGFLVPVTVSAAVDFSQTTGDGAVVQTANLSSANWYLLLGQLPSTSNGNTPIELAMTLSDNETDTINVGIICGSTPFVPAGGCSGAWAGASVKYFNTDVQLPSSPQTIVFSSSTMPAYQSGMYYALTMSRNNVGYTGTVSFRGSSTASSTCIAGCPTNTGQPFYAVTSSAAPVVSTDSRVVSVNTPTQFQQTGSATVDFSFTYYSGDPLVTFAGAELTDTHIGQNIYYEESVILGSGYGTSTRSLTLTEGHGYTYRPYIRNSDGSVRLYGESITFWVVSNQWQSLIPTSTAAYEEAASSTESLGQVATMGGMLMARPPFLWFAQINAAYASSTTSTGEEMPTLTIDMGDTLIPFTADMFSSTTLSTFIPEETHDRLYGIMQASIYAFGVYALYRRVQGAFNKDENEI